jgi:hypothetical protein
LILLPIFLVRFPDPSQARGAFIGALQLILRADVTRQTPARTPCLGDGAFGTKSVVGVLCLWGFVAGHRFASNGQVAKIFASPKAEKSQNDQHNDHKADDVYDPIHGIPIC